MEMNLFAYLLLQIINGYDWQPQFNTSTKFKHWIAILDLKTCLFCRKLHGKIWLLSEYVAEEMSKHKNCRCKLKPMVSITAGTATIDKTNGADWFLKYYSKLPNSYISYEKAIANGWNPLLGNLHNKCPNLQITKGVYKNRNGHLPTKESRVWFEADINYRFGFRNTQRILYSNDGLIFVTFDHYKTFYEIV